MLNKVDSLLFVFEISESLGDVFTPSVNGEFGESSTASVSTTTSQSSRDSRHGSNYTVGDGSKYDLQIMILPFYEAFKAFHAVVDGVFGNNLVDDWREKVAMAEQKIQATGVNITTKVLQT